MALGLKIHRIQSAILVTLLFKPKSRFGELNKLDVPSDQFNFHLKTLVANGLINKTPEGSYQLTNSGKEFANRYDTQEKILERQAKISVLVKCIKEENGKTYYLMQERLKEPYYGFLGGISGKIKWGELAVDAAKRELKEETNLEGTPEFIGIEHKIDYDNRGNLLEDKFFYIFRVNKFKGKLKIYTEGGENKWMTEEEIFSSGKTFDDVNDAFEIVKSKVFKFIEKRYKVKKY